MSLGCVTERGRLSWSGYLSWSWGWLSPLSTASTHLATQVSSQDVREGIMDGSEMIYKVRLLEYYNATGTIGDQRYT